MVNIIVGDNAIGKTLVLYEKERISNTISNMAVLSNSEYLVYDIERAKKISHLLGCGDVVYGNKVSFETTNVYGIKELMSDSMKHLLRLCSTKGDKLVLDEPDVGLSDRETATLAFMLGSELFALEFKDIWISTHNSFLLNIDECNYYTITDKGLTSISRKEAYEYTN
jgi:hypothetical protein